VKQQSAGRRVAPLLTHYSESETTKLSSPSFHSQC